MRVALAWVLLCASTAAAQDRGAARGEAAPPPSVAAPAPTVAHHFWDATNVMLIGGVAASRAMDFTSTGHFRALGDREWLLSNRIVDNKPLFATIELAGVAAAIGVAGLLHRTQHHRLERWVSVLHIGVTVGGAIHNYRLKAPSAAHGGR